MAAPVYTIRGALTPLVLTGTSYRPGVSVRRAAVTSPQRHGVTAAGPVVFDEAVLTLRCLVQPGSEQTLDEAVAVTLAALAAPGDLGITRAHEGVTTASTARLVNVAEPTYYPADRFAVLTVTLALPGVFFRDLSPVTSAAVPASGTSPLTALAGGSAPITDAVVRVAGPVASVDVRDALSGTGLSWSGTLPVGQYLYLDAGSLTARRTSASSAWTSGGAAASGGLDYPPPGPLQLWPDPSITVTAVGAGESTTVVVRAARAYL